MLLCYCCNQGRARSRLWLHPPTSRLSRRLGNSLNRAQKRLPNICAKIWLILKMKKSGMRHLQRHRINWFMRRVRSYTVKCKRSYRYMKRTKRAIPARNRLLLAVEQSLGEKGIPAKPISQMSVHTRGEFAIRTDQRFFRDLPAVSRRIQHS